MCQYTYAYYFCGHGYFIYSSSLEFCANRSLSAYSLDVWAVDMCRDCIVTCNGISSSHCRECSEDHTLEFELDE